jgi:hypothetical protein
VLTEEKLDDMGARLEGTPRKSLKRLAQETGMSKSNVRSGAQLLKLRHYKRVVHALQLRDPDNRIHFGSWFSLSAVES